MKNLLISFTLLLSTTSFAASLMPKYECDLTKSETESVKATVYVGEDFLCGTENTKYEMALVTPTSEEDELGSVDTGTVSYSLDSKVTVIITGNIEGTKIEMPITMDLSKDGQKGNSTFKYLADIDSNGNPKYSEIKVTCSTTIQYNMDCSKK
jgi:hypothetical protein